MVRTTKQEKLLIAGYAAPRLRAAKSRVVKVVDKDGQVIREISMLEVQAKMLERVGVELDGLSEVRKCDACGRVTLLKKDKNGRVLRGKIVKCKECMSVPCETCGIRVKINRSNPGRRFCPKHSIDAIHSKKPEILCEICGLPSSRSQASRARAVGAKMWRCPNHPRKVGLVPKSVPCAICGEPVFGNGARHARSRGTRAYCGNHRGGKTNVK